MQAMGFEIAYAINVFMFVSYQLSMFAEGICDNCETPLHSIS